MPNVRGLAPAPDILTGMSPNHTVPYGPHMTVSHDGTTVTLQNGRNRIVATVTFKPGNVNARVILAQVDRDTVTAVNALLRPYGKVKDYWRLSTPEKPVYRWHPHEGAPSPVPTLSTPPTPKPSPSVPMETRSRVVITPTAGAGKGVTVEEIVPDPEPIVPVPTLSVPHPATHGAIETVRRWQDRGLKQPTARSITKNFSTVDDVLVPTRDLRRLDAMRARRIAGQAAFGIITGPAGTAKTRLAQAWAFVNDLPVVIIEGQSIQTASDWFGSLVPNHTPGATSPFIWEWSDAALLIMSGDPCLIVVDELNRPENERALNGIMGLTDWRGVVKPVGAPEALTLAPGQCIIATLNEGPEFVGTVEVDAAVRNRFSIGIRMDYATEPVEVRILLQQAPGIDKEVAKRLVRIAHAQRGKRDDDLLYPSHNIISTRALVDIAQNITVGGLDPAEAVWANVDSAFWPEDRPALKVLVEGQFGPDAAPVDDGLADDDELEQMLGDL